MNYNQPYEAKTYSKLMQSVCRFVLLSIWLVGCTVEPAVLPTATSLPTVAAPTQGNLNQETPTSAPPTITPTTLSDPERQIMTQRLIQAAEAGEISTVTELLQAGADINGRDEQGRTAAMAATHANQVEMVRVLIEAGADINIQDDRLDNPFLYAGAEGLLDILKLTIDAQADPR
ncbi:MAG TPA: ankyrin repeat domain-containing protein, partial [Anaerolineales bacterium]|nr:ankyrin repeat domain-containing protein [Anaerolineales bacterium]